MGFEPNPKEMESVSSLKVEERYRHSVAKIADWEEVWGLADEQGWALLGDSQRNEVFPIWPAKAYAKLWCKDVWESHDPKLIELDSWIDPWLVGLEEDGVKISVFPTLDCKGIIVNPSGRRADLLEELKKY